jgi:pimeloyl-ACP methyl ester carboxylesterase
VRTTSGVAYDDSGHGEPALLFLPGWCVDRSAFADLFGICSSRHRSISLDWHGHGESAPAGGDFGQDALVDDALAVIAHSGVRRIVPVALSHAGWVAIELRRRLGARVPSMILVDWIVADPPPSFLAALDGLQDAQQWLETRSHLFSMWQNGVDNPRVSQVIHHTMAAYPFDMWSRAGREIKAAYHTYGSPLAQLQALDPPRPAMHLYAQPDDPQLLRMQQAFAARHPWFSVKKITATSHFPMLEVPGVMAELIEQFVCFNES